MLQAFLANSITLKMPRKRSNLFYYSFSDKEKQIYNIETLRQ